MAVMTCSRDVKTKSEWVPGTFTVSMSGTWRLVHSRHPIEQNRFPSLTGLHATALI
jgi:hypothetical protein